MSFTAKGIEGDNRTRIFEPFRLKVSEIGSQLQSLSTRALDYQLLARDKQSQHYGRSEQISRRELEHVMPDTPLESPVFTNPNNPDPSSSLSDLPAATSE